MFPREGTNYPPGRVIQRKSARFTRALSVRPVWPSVDGIASLIASWESCPEVAKNGEGGDSRTILAVLERFVTAHRLGVTWDTLAVWRVRNRSVTRSAVRVPFSWRPTTSRLSRSTIALTMRSAGDSLRWPREFCELSTPEPKVPVRLAPGRDRAPPTNAASTQARRRIAFSTFATSARSGTGFPPSRIRPCSERS